MILYFLLEVNIEYYYLINLHKNLRFFFIGSKDKFFNVFKPWLEKDKIKTQYKLNCLRVDGSRKFISLVLKKFCESKEIIFGYTSLYTHNKNGLIERY